MSKPEGAELFKKLVRETDVVIESFRPGTLERWGLSYEELSRENPGLVLARVTGFGQLGPYSNRPGFGTIAESMSGFAHVTGQPAGPPTPPPLGPAPGAPPPPRAAPHPPRLRPQSGVQARLRPRPRAARRTTAAPTVRPRRRDRRPRNSL